MSTLPSLDVQHGQPATETNAGMRAGSSTLAICLPSMPADDLTAMVRELRQLFVGEPLVIASPDHAEEQEVGPDGTRLVPYPVQRTDSEWVLNALDYAAAARLVAERGAAGVLLLGTEATTLSAGTMVSLRQALGSNVDLVVPRYRTGPEEGLVNSALLYPLTRALFGVDIRFPLPLDAAVSPRMLTRLASVATRVATQEDGLIWPVAEAAIAGYSVRQTESGERSLPRPQEADLNVLFPAVTSALFADIEAKATFWQRARTVPAGRTFTPSAAQQPEAEGAEEIRSMVDGFRLAFSNLREIWSLVLPPQTLLALKKLSMSPAETFSFPPSLWARVVYDFAIAFHLRTLNRGHLMGALTPLYLAWVASLLREGGGTPGSAALLESTASAFEQEKPYVVSRWRWPDRFNP